MLRLFTKRKYILVSVSMRIFGIVTTLVCATSFKNAVFTCISASEGIFIYITSTISNHIVKTQLKKRIFVSDRSFLLYMQTCSFMKSVTFNSNHFIPTSSSLLQRWLPVLHLFFSEKSYLYHLVFFCRIY